MGRNQQDQKHRVTAAAEVASVKQQYIAEDAYKRDGTAGVASEISAGGCGRLDAVVSPFRKKCRQLPPRMYSVW